MPMPFKIEKAAEVPAHLLVRNVNREFEWKGLEVGHNFFVPATYWAKREGISEQVRKDDEKLLKTNPKAFADKVTERMKASYANFRASDPVGGKDKTVGCDHEFSADGKAYNGSRVWIMHKPALTPAQIEAAEKRRKKAAKK